MSEQPIIQNNAEIDEALKEFEAKAPEALKTSPIPQREVEGVKFETDTYKAVKFYNETAVPKIVKAVIKYSGGTVKNQRQAEWILFGFVVVAIGISLYLVFGRGFNNSTPKIPDWNTFPGIVHNLK
jgi:hypothetical protein